MGVQAVINIRPFEAEGKQWSVTFYEVIELNIRKISFNLQSLKLTKLKPGFSGSYFLLLSFSRCHFSLTPHFE